MIRTVVVDDEHVARRGLVRLLEDEPDVEVVGEAADGEEAIGLIRRRRPDLVFLDIQMPEKDGLVVAEELRRLDPVPVVVFVTAHATHAVRAFELDAADYLLKPFDRDRFRRTLDRATRDLRRAALDGVEAGAGTLERLGRSGGARRVPDRLVLEEGGRVVFLRPDEVDWVEAAGNYVRIRAGAEEHLVRGTLTDLAERLSGHGFLRISRSTVVNLARVREVEPGSSGTRVVVLEGGRRFGVSRRSWPRLRREIVRLGEKGRGWEGLRRAPGNDPP